MNEKKTYKKPESKYRIKCATLCASNRTTHGSGLLNNKEKYQYKRIA